MAKSEIRAYTVQAALAAVPVPSDLGTTTGSTFQLTGVPSGTYLVRVSAVNTFGTTVSPPITVVVP